MKNRLLHFIIRIFTRKKVDKSCSERGSFHAFPIAPDVVTNESIQHFLANLKKNKGCRLDKENSLVIAGQLESQKQRNESLSIKLLSLADRAESFENLEYLTANLQDRVIKNSIISCEECVNLSQDLGLPVMTMKFLCILGAKQSRIGQWSQASSVLQKAKNLRREMAAEDACIYYDCLVYALCTLGNALNYQQAFSEVRAEYQDARNHYCESGFSAQEVYEAKVASILTDLGGVFFQLHTYAMARTTLEEALFLQRTHDEDRQNTSMSLLAKTLAGLGIVLAEQKFFPEARKVCEESVRILRQLVAGDRHKHQTELFVALSNLANILNHQRNYSVAKPLYEEAILIAEPLVAKESHSLKHRLATTLNNLATLLMEQSLLSKAEILCEQAIDYIRPFANEKRLDYRESLSLFLATLGNILCKQGTSSKARVAYEESISILRELVMKAHDVFIADLASTLSNFGNFLIEQGELVDAHSALFEALSIQQEIALKDPYIFEPAKAITLGNLGTLFATQRAYPEARWAFEETLAIYRNLASRESHAYGPLVASTLRNMAIVLSDQGESSEARKAFEEALLINRSLSEEGSQALPNLAVSLNSLGAFLDEQQEFDKARHMYEEAIDIYRKLVLGEPKAYKPFLAMVLANLGAHLHENGLFSEAMSRFEESFSIYQELAIKEPHLHLPHLAKTLDSIGILFESQNRWEKCLASYKKAVDIAESMDIPLNKRYLVRGSIESSYWAVVMHHAKERNTSDLFGHLIALREPTIRPKSDALLRTKEAIFRAENRLDRKICVLVIQPLRKGVLVGTIRTDKKSFFDYEIVTDFHEQIALLLQAYNNWAEAWEQLAKKAEYGDNVSASGSYSKMCEGAARIRKAGHVAWKALPEWIQTTIEPRSGYDILLSISGNWAHLPFEMLCYGEGEDHYIGLKRALPRLGGLSSGYFEKLRRSYVGNGSLNVLLVADPENNLQAARKEGVAIKQLLEERGLIVKGLGSSFNVAITNESYEQALMSCLEEGSIRLDKVDIAIDVEATDKTVTFWLAKPLSIFHYTGHGMIADENTKKYNTTWSRHIGEEVLCLGKRTLLGASALRDKILDTNPLIVLNSCMTGRSREFGGMREDLAGTLLRIGAEAIVANAAYVSSYVGLVFGRKLYSDFSLELHESFLKSRRAAFDTVTQHPDMEPLWPCWSLFILYGNPYARLPMA